MDWWHIYLSFYQLQVEYIGWYRQVRIFKSLYISGVRLRLAYVQVQLCRDKTLEFDFDILIEFDFNILTTFLHLHYSLVGTQIIIGWEHAS